MKIAKNWIFVGLSTAYLAWYFYYLCQYSVNLPYIDDYDAILGYILRFKETSPWTQVKSLFLPHSEHIMVLTRLVSWCSYGLVGKINIAALIVVGNGLLLFQLWLLFRISKQLNPAYFFLVVMVFLNPQYSPTSFWAMALWSNIWVFVPITLSILFLTNNKTWYWALPFAILSLFSNGNGLLIWPIGVFIFWMSKRPLFQYVVWISSGAFYCGIYFYLMRQQPSTGIFEMSNLPMLPLNVLAFVGSYSALMGGKIGQLLAILTGFGVFFIGVITFKKYVKSKDKIDLGLLSLLAFVFLTAIVVALFRADKGISIVIGGRYRQYSSLAVAIGFLMAFRLFQFGLNRYIRLLPWVAVSIITALSFFRDIGLRRATEWRSVTDYHNFLHNQLDIYTVDGSPRFGKIAHEARNSRLFVPSSKYDLVQQLQKASIAVLEGEMQQSRHEETKADGVTCGNYWQVEALQLELPTGVNEGIYLVATNKNRHVIFPTASKRNNIRTMLQKRRYFKKGVEAEVYNCAQSLIGYRISWLKVGSKPTVYATNTTIFAP